MQTSTPESELEELRERASLFSFLLQEKEMTELTLMTERDSLFARISDLEQKVISFRSVPTGAVEAGV